jgi:formiminotetrahydrofolate cyclodeaminase
MPAPDPGEYRGLSLAAFLDEVAAATPAPGGGSVVAVAAALAAALCSMAARKSPGVPGGSAAMAETADARRLRALTLASEDAAAYARVLAAKRAGTNVEEVELAPGLPLLEEALSAAADVPMELAGIAAEIAGVASDLVAGGNINLVGDSLAAALLASGAAEAAAALVAINLAGEGGGPTGEGRAARASELAADAEAAAGRARAAAERRLGSS